MKYYLIIISLAFNVTLFGQKSDEFEVVSIIENQKFTLNSQSRIGGTKRSYLFVNLPPNTVSWIYMLTTNKSSTPAALNLLPQVLKLVPSMGVTSSLLSSLTFPTGESSINAYVLGKDQYSNFINQNEFNYYPPASRQAFNSGPVKVDYPYNNGQYYIGLDNPSAISAVNITIDVVALVKRKNLELPNIKNQVNNNNNQNNKSGLQLALEALQKSLNKPNNQTNNTNTSINNQTSANNTTTSINNQTSTNNTTTSINNQISPNSINSLRQEDSLNKKRTQAYNIGNLGWYAFERGDINGCIDQSKKSTSIYPLFFAKANLGLCYLIKGNDSQALDEYVSALELLEYDSDSKKSLKGAIKDIEKVKNKQKLNSVADDILKLLRSNL